MPDFVIVPVATCATNIHWETTAESSSGGSYRVAWERQFIGSSQYGWSCECKGFRFRRTCKHVKAAEQERCGWNRFLEPTFEADRDANGEFCCPECGGPVEFLRVGV